MYSDVNKIEILTMPSYSDVLKENFSFLKEKLPSYDFTSDSKLNLIVEAFAYRELHLRAMVNQKIKNMLPQYATGSDLDAFVFAFYGGLTRLEGAYPYASFKFSLKDDEKVVVPKGSIVTNFHEQRGRVVRDIELTPSSPKKVESVELLEYVETSKIELTRLLDYPSIVVAQLREFTNGALAEDDDRFRKRAFLSLNRFSTAGSFEAYYYYVLASDVRVDSVHVYTPSPGVVRIVLDNFLKKIDNRVLDRIKDYLSSDKIRPLTDKVEVIKATTKNISITAEIEVFDLNQQQTIDSLIENNFRDSFKISEDLTLSDVVSRLHVEGVYLVKLINPTTSVIIKEHERIVIKEVNCVYTRAKI